MLPSFGIQSRVVRMWTDVSGESITSISRVENLPSNKPACSSLLTRSFLLSVPTNWRLLHARVPQSSQRVSIKFIRAIFVHEGYKEGYTTLYPRRWQHSLPLLEPQMLKYVDALLETTRRLNLNFLISILPDLFRQSEVHDTASVRCYV
jgi:hypothetical protein